MALPTYEELMPHVLDCLSDGQLRTMAELRDLIATRLQLTPDELGELLPSGRMPTFNSRTHWAKFYLQKAGAVDSPKRGTVALTARGRALAQEPGVVTTALLAQRFPEFQDWIAASRSPKASRPLTRTESETPDSALDPEEALVRSFEELKQMTIDGLLTLVRAMPANQFESLVMALLSRLGYGGPEDIEVVGGSGDGGIDGIIKGDRLGLELVYVQAKRWKDNVGSPVVREFAGSLSARKASKGVLITTSDFTADARRDADRMSYRIVLVGGRELGELLFETELGVTTQKTYAIKAVDTDFFGTDD